MIKSWLQRPETKKYAADGKSDPYCFLYDKQNSLTQIFFFLSVVAVFALSQVAFYFAFKYIVGSLDPTKAKRQEAKAKSNRVLGKLGVRIALVIAFFLQGKA